MKCIDLYTRDPYFNLAAEEYLLKQSEEEFFMIYVNDPSVVVGKHQNAVAEMNLSFVLQSGLKPARRISGGGAVYHDGGNLNFSFITNEEEGDFIQFKKYTRPILEALDALGLTATLGKRNELLLGDQKITGTASHVYKHRVLHHGTLLFDADRDALTASLSVRPERYTDKAVRSVRSVITTIRDHLERDMDMHEFCHHVFGSVMDALSGSTLYRYSASDITAIRSLAKEKFSSWDWTFGYSPRYTFHNVFEAEGDVVSVVFEIKKGRIETAEFLLNGVRVPEKEQRIQGVRHAVEELALKLDGWGHEEILHTLF